MMSSSRYTLLPDTRHDACAQTKAVQQLAIFQRALQEIDEDEALALEQQLASLLDTQASGLRLVAVIAEALLQDVPQKHVYALANPSAARHMPWQC